MSETTAHPSHEQLSAYNLGQLPPDEAVAIESHISDCEPCCDTIVSLSSDDTFVGLLKEARQLPADQTVDHGVATASSLLKDVPTQLAEHPRYEIVRLIGRGGMGDVYEARHRKMERTVALKVINRELVRKPEAVNRFHREVKTAAQQSHPNIVTSFDADHAGDFHFMVMEYVDGVDLSQTVKDRGAIPIAEACEYIRQAAIGLQHAHEQGMVHRDIKPHNLMVTADGTVKILDFGLASLATETLSDTGTVEARGDLTAAGAIMGTPDFISPEQADDARQADIRSDIYSLGSTLYFLLSGQPPFAEGSVMHKLKSHAQVEPQPLQSIRDDIPADLAAVVARMTAKNPDDRYQSPLEVAEALESFTRPTPAQTSGAPYQPLPGGIRGRAMTLLTVVTLLFALVASAVVYYIQTNKGVIRVRVMDDSLAVTIKGQMVEMKDGDKQLTIRAGHHKLEVSHRDSDFKFLTNLFDAETAKPVMTLHEGEQPAHFLQFSPSGRYLLVGIGNQGRMFEVPRPGMSASGRSWLVGQHGPITHARFDREETRILTGSKDQSVILWRNTLKGEDIQTLRHQGELTTVRFSPDEKSILTASTNPQNGKHSVEVWDAANGKLQLRIETGAAVSAIFTKDGKQIASVGKDTITWWNAFDGTEVKSFHLAGIDYNDAHFADDRLHLVVFFENQAVLWDLLEASPIRKLTTFAHRLKTEGVPNDSQIDYGKFVDGIPVSGQFSTDLRPGYRRFYMLSDKGVFNEWPVARAKAILRERAESLRPELGMQKQAANALAAGDTAKARELLRTVSGVGSWRPPRFGKSIASNSDAAVAFKLAELLETQDSSDKAADAYLEAYRLEPRLLSIKHVATIKKAQRTSELVEVLTEANLKKLGRYSSLSVSIVKSLLNDEASRADGYRLLKRVWVTRNSSDILSLLSMEEIWRQAPDLDDYLRAKLIPSDIASEGSGWGRFTIEGVYEGSEEPGWGIPLSLRPLVKDKDVVRKLVREVETAIKQHPHWKAGVAVLSYLEAETGNYERATDLITQVLADSETRPIPSDSAFVFGMALEGKNAELDRQVMRLYESSLRNRPARVFRASAIPKLARLHAKYGERPEARRVLNRLNDVDYDPSGSHVICTGVLAVLKPLIQDPEVVAELSDEIERLIEYHEHWKAGRAVLCFVQAESGNYARAAEILHEILVDAQTHPIPGDAAWGLGLVLQNRDSELDRLVMQLYRHGQETMPWVYARRSSPLADLARLTAKYGEKEKARDLLLRMSESYYDVDSPDPTISCPYPGSCTKCHKRERNFYDFTYMAGQLTDLGYPLEGYIALGRVDSSFQGAFSGDQQWTREKLGSDLSNERKEFDGAKAKVIQGLDASAILHGFEVGSFRGDSNEPFDLLLTIRGKRHKRTLFSPIIEVLELAVESKEGNSTKDIAELDKRLVTLSEQHPNRIEAGIAATVFAFLRDALDSAKDRLQQLQAVTDYPESDGAAFWLVARHALQYEQTRIIGSVLAEKAVAAAGKHPDSGLKEAIVRERSGIRTK